MLNNICFMIYDIALAKNGKPHEDIKTILILAVIIVTRISIASNNAKVIFWILPQSVSLIYYQYPLYDSGLRC